MTLHLENIAITGRTFEEYSVFFDLKLQDLKGKKSFRLSKWSKFFCANFKTKWYFFKRR